MEMPGGADPQFASGRAGPGLLAKATELLTDRGTRKMCLDLVEALALQRAADVVKAGASAGAGEDEGSFECSEAVHSLHMAPTWLKT